MSERKPIHENELDNLLRDLYLEENSKNANEKEADFVLSQDYDANVNPAKERELLARLNKGRGGFGSFKIYLSVLIVIGLSVYLWFHFSINSNKNPKDTSEQITKNTGTTSQTENPVAVSENNNASSVTNLDGHVKVPDTFGRPKILSSIIKPDSTVNYTENTPPISVKTETSVPFLTEKDRLRYLKVKRQMLDKLLKADKGLYTHIEAGKFSYAGNTVITDAFTLRNVAISNLEYKTFLADLLAQKKKEAYLTAQIFPVNSKSQYADFSVRYFQDEKYNDFPVVNITYEGAKLFCKWLEEEIKIYIQQNKLKIKPLEIRLPYDEEWIYAAREGYAKIAFEKGYNTMYDITEGLVDKSFSNRAELIKKRVKRIDTLYTLYTTNRFGWSEKEIVDFLSKGFSAFNTTVTDTIYTERMKVFGKLGRVSEMVPQKSSTHLWLAGLSWKNKDEYLKLENEFKSEHYSPFVGFRLVIINSNDPEYKNPFW